MDDGRPRLKLSELFFAGIITAAGAATFWWIKKKVTEDKPAPPERDELDDLMLVSGAADVTYFDGF